MKKECGASLLESRNSVQRNIAALRNLGRDIDGYNDFLVHRIVSKLDLKTQRDWELEIASSTDFLSFSNLNKFLLERIRVLDSIKPIDNIEKLKGKARKVLASIVKWPRVQRITSQLLKNIVIFVTITTRLINARSFRIQLLPNGLTWRDFEGYASTV